MHSYDYLIVGGGMAADSVAKGIRLEDRAGRVGLISEELDAPYNRPPLSKAVWQGLPLEQVYRPTPGRQVQMHLGRRVVELDLARHVVRDERGEIYRYGKLCLATGGRPKRLQGTDSGVIYFRTLADFRRLHACVRPGARVALIGGGLVNTELASVLAAKGASVTLIHRAQTLLNRILPPLLALQLQARLQSQGIRLLLGACANQALTPSRLQLGDGNTLDVEVIVAGLGLQPNDELAKAAGLQVDGGIVVQEDLRTSHPDVFAAGDVCRFYCPALGRSIRGEHEEHANFSGIAAGRAMAGRLHRYDVVPYFYSQVGELLYEGVGDTDTRLKLTCEPNPTHPGAWCVRYWEASRLRGMLFWNGGTDVERAQQLIRAQL